MVARPQTTVPLDDTTPRAVVQVHVIQEQKKRWVQYTPLFFQYSSTPLRKPDRNTGMGNRGKVEEAHTKRGLNSQGEGGLKDCACWSGEA